MVLKNNSVQLMPKTNNYLLSFLSYSYFKNCKEAEKQEIINRIATAIAHEVRNPLTTVRGYLQLLQDNIDFETSSLISNVLLPEIDTVDKVITNFLKVATPKQPYTEIIDIKAFLKEDIKNYLHTYLLNHEVSMKIEALIITKQLKIKGNRNELEQVFSILFNNSLQARTIQPLHVNIQFKQIGSYVQIIFTDNGQGIEPNNFSKIFDPFFSTKDHCMGLGLSIAKKIIENHDGYVTFESNPSKTKFYMYFPICI